MRDGCARALPIGDRNGNPKGISLPRLLAEDLQTHGGRLTAPGFLAVAVHRLGNWRMDVKARIFRAPLTLAYRSANAFVTSVWGIDLPYSAQIGRRFRIDHHGAVYVGAWAVGDDVTIRHSVTIGLARRNAERVPIIGDRVEFGPGACVVGDACVGNDCHVVANSVLAADLPDGTAAIGVPARQIEKADLPGASVRRPAAP